MKRTKLISLLSALLAVIMLLASCGSPFDGGSSPADDSKYMSNVSAWFEYLEYNEDYTKEIFAQKLTQSYKLSSENTVVIDTISEGLVAFKQYTFRFGEETALYEYPDAEYKGNIRAYEIPANVKYVVYDVIKDVEVWSAATTATLTFNYDDFSYDYLHLGDAYNVEDNTDSYDIELFAGVAFFKVTKIHTYTPAATEENPTPAPVTEYTYAAYDIGGALLDSSDEALEVANTRIHLDAEDENGNIRYTLYEAVVGDKKYVTRDGKIIYVTDTWNNRTLPAVSVSFDTHHYAYFEDDGLSNDYVVQIFDASYTFKKEIRFENVGSADAYPLSNGSLLVSTVELVPDDSEDYDVISTNGLHAKFNYTLVSKDGQTAELDIPYLIEGSVFENAISDSSTSYKVKDGYNLVSCYPVPEDKKVEEFEEKIVYCIFDDSMNPVSELPKVVEGQIGVPEFISEDEILIGTFTAGFESAYYSATNNSSERPLLYANPGDMRIGGIFSNGKLYNSYGEHVIDLTLSTSYVRYEIINDDFYGSVIFKRYGSSYSEGGSTYIAHVNDGQLVERQIPNGYREENGFIVYEDSGSTYYCDLLGNSIYSQYDLISTTDVYNRGNNSVYAIICRTAYGSEITFFK